MRSYRTVSPLPPLRVAVYFLWHCPAGFPGLPLTSTLLCDVRTFLDPSKESSHTAGQKPFAVAGTDLVAAG